MAWKIRSSVGSQRLGENLELEPTTTIEFMVDHPTDPNIKLGPFRIQVPQAYTEQQIRDLLDADAAKWANLARGG